jgi:outer membrane protein insertion porin family
VINSRCDATSRRASTSSARATVIRSPRRIGVDLRGGVRRWRGRAVAGLFVAAMFVGAARLAAQEPQLAGEPIAAVEFQGLRTLSEETVRYYLGLEVGQTFDPVQLDANIHSLWERDLIDDITVEAAPTANGIHVTLRIVERPVLRSIEYEGLKKVGRTDLQERIDREQIRVREGSPLDLGELERLSKTLRELYEEKGYRFAEITYAMEEVSVGERRVRFTIDEGDKVKIGNIDFDGNTVFRDVRLRLTMRKTKETGLVSRLMKRDIYNPATLQEDLGKLRDLYRERGYKNVTIGEPEIEVHARRPDAPTAAQQRRRLLLTIPIDEGERWRFGDISIEGNEVYADEVLLRAFNRPRGEWLRASAVDKGVEAVGDLYRNSGYLYSNVEVELQERPENVADVVIRVFEGDQFTVGRLEFQGNDRTRDKVLRREFRVQEGMVLNMGALRNSLLKVRQLEYFELDEENPIEFRDIDRDAKTVDLVVQGTEADRTELLFGGGWSELDGFFGQFSMRTQNFLGRGETVGISLQSGKVRDLFELSYFVPWLLDRPQSVGFQLFKRDLDYNLLDTQRQVREETGGVFTYGRSFGFFQSVRLQYGYAEFNDMIEFIDSTNGQVISTFSEYEKSNLRPVWQFDSIDSRIEPTRGMRMMGSVEYAGGVLGGNVELWRPEVEFTWYRPLQRQPVRTVFAFTSEGGLIEPIGNLADLPLLERYYIGGARSLRGHASRSISLRDEADSPVRDTFGNLLGGTSYVRLGLEYHVLLGGPFRLVLFADGGNVFGDDCGVNTANQPTCGQSFSIDNLRYSAGAELRLFVPVFGLPLRFIYAENLNPLPGDRFESFQFDVGTSF